MNRRLGVRVTALLLLFTFICTFCCACSPEYPKAELTYFDADTLNPQYYNFVPQEYEFSKLEPVSAEWQEFLDTNYQSQVDFLNEYYGAGWKYSAVEAYGVDLGEANISFNVAGIYDPNTDRVYLDVELLQKSPSQITPKELGIISHEGQHYIKMLNTHTPMFVLKNGRGELGRVFSEAMTNAVAIEWLDHTGSTEAACALRDTGYASVTLLCEELKLICPDLLKAYVENDISSLEKSFVRIAEAHIATADSDIFESWLWQFDLLYEAEHAYKASNNDADLLLSMFYLLGNMEVLAAMTENDHAPAFCSLFQEYDEAYCGGMYCGTTIESGSSDMGFLIYFDSLFYEEIN